MSNCFIGGDCPFVCVPLPEFVVGRYASAVTVVPHSPTILSNWYFSHPDSDERRKSYDRNYPGYTSIIQDVREGGPAHKF